MSIQLDLDNKVEATASFSTNLVVIPNCPLELFKQKQRDQFKLYNDEMMLMKVDLKEKPSADSLMYLYEAQVKGKAFSERAGEIYRGYLQYVSSIKMLKMKAEMQFKEEYDKSLEIVRRTKGEEYKACKGAEERANLVNAAIPKALKEELFQWQCLEQEANTNFQIIKSYYENFKSIKDEILVQLSIVKQLIALGGLKIDPEAVRAMQIIETSYRPTNRDIQERNDQQSGTVSMDEGVVEL